jgi:hypothetical protein
MQQRAVRLAYDLLVEGHQERNFQHLEIVLQAVRFAVDVGSAGGGSSAQIIGAVLVMVDVGGLV